MFYSQALVDPKEVMKLSDMNNESMRILDINNFKYNLYKHRPLDPVQNDRNSMILVGGGPGGSTSATRNAQLNHFKSDFDEKQAQLNLQLKKLKEEALTQNSDYITTNLHVKLDRERFQN